MKKVRDIFKKAPQVPVSVEIDYTKLAEAIVKAQEIAKEKPSPTADTFSALASSIFRFTSWGISIFSILIIFATTAKLSSLSWDTSAAIASNSILALLLILFIFVLIMLSRLLNRSAKEMEKEKDRNYIAVVFSCVVSLAALVVSLVALLKDIL